MTPMLKVAQICNVIEKLKGSVLGSLIDQKVILEMAKLDSIEVAENS